MKINEIEDFNQSKIKRDVIKNIRRYFYDTGTNETTLHIENDGISIVATLDANLPFEKMPIKFKSLGGDLTVAAITTLTDMPEFVNNIIIRAPKFVNLASDTSIHTTQFVISDSKHLVNLENNGNLTTGRIRLQMCGGFKSLKGIEKIKLAKGYDRFTVELLDCNSFDDDPMSYNVRIFFGTEFPPKMPLLRAIALHHMPGYSTVSFKPFQNYFIFHPELEQYLGKGAKAFRPIAEYYMKIGEYHRIGTVASS